MNPYVSLEQAKQLKEAGYDQTIEKTDKHYILLKNKHLHLTNRIDDFWNPGDGA